MGLCGSRERLGPSGEMLIYSLSVADSSKPVSHKTLEARNLGVILNTSFF